VLFNLGNLLLAISSNIYTLCKTGFREVPVEVDTDSKMQWNLRNTPE